MNYVRAVGALIGENILEIQALDDDIMVITSNGLSRTALRRVRDSGYAIESIEHLPQGVKIWLRKENALNFMRDVA